MGQKTKERREAPNEAKAMAKYTFAPAIAS
jgi:hypothetical protein